MKNPTKYTDQIFVEGHADDCSYARYGFHTQTSTALPRRTVYSTYFGTYHWLTSYHIPGMYKANDLVCTVVTRSLHFFPPRRTENRYTHFKVWIDDKRFISQACSWKFEMGSGGRWCGHIARIQQNAWRGTALSTANWRFQSNDRGATHGKQLRNPEWMCLEERYNLYAVQCIRQKREQRRSCTRVNLTQWPWR